MKKFTFFVLLLISFVAVKSYSQIIFDENFNYPAGDSIGAHGWVYNTGVVNTIMVVSPGLTFSGFVNSGIGNACRLRNNGNDAYANMNDSVLSNSVYISFMINVDSSQAAGDYFLALLPNNSTTNYVARTYIKDTTGGFSLGISKGTSASNPIIWGPIYTRGVTYCVVIKYTFLTGTTTDDVINGYVFSAGVPGSEPGSPTIGPVTGPATDAPNISRIAIRQGSATIAPTLNIDGFRGSRSWQNIPLSVIPISTVAKDFQLKQNYPNPFNPTTNIEFSVPKSSYVTLKVYDIMGREVKSLVNEVMQEGTYKADFDAVNLSSGTYYYRINMTELVSGKSFVDTKTMVLVK